VTDLSCDDLAMEAPRVEAEIIEFYTSRYDEDARLSAQAHGALEFARTQEILRRHLPDRTDRLQALREARRVLRPGGLMAAAVISRNSALLDLAVTDRLGSDTVMRAILDNGHHDPALGFTTAYFHTAEELTSEVTEAGFTDVRLYGVEGPLWHVLTGIEAYTGESLTDSRLFGSAATAARLTETDPAIVAASAHILAIGYRGGEPR
jgi:hypothetical protein